MRNYQLFTPGPIDIPDDVIKATAHKCIYHREEKFKFLLNSITESLKEVIDCKHKLYILTASGTGALEAAYVNIMSKSDTPVVAVCGKFGERWVELCKSYGNKPIIIREEFGKSIKPEMVEQVLRNAKKPAVVFTTLTETSTGVVNDIKAISEVVKRYDGYLVIDGVAGIGADPFYQDKWNVDVLCGASQKALMAPPGIAFVSFSQHAHLKMKNSDLPKYYFDFSIYEKFLENGQTPFTPAITILYGLKKGLEKLLTIGVEENFARHQKTAQYARNRLTRNGYELFPKNPSNGLTVIKMPTGIDSGDVIKECKEKYGILFANGQGEMKGKILRIGHMGNYTIKKLSHALDIFDKVMAKKLSLKPRQDTYAYSGKEG